jgi:type III secretion protein J
MNAFATRAVAALGSCLVLAGCKVDLYSGLDETSANDIVAALSAQGMDARKEHQESAGWQVQVDEERLGAALAVLRAQGLPQARFASMGEMFQKQGLVSTPAEERMRYIYAVSQELSQTLRSIDGVVEARVHVVIPENDPLSDKVRPSSAAVFIKHRPDVDLRLLVPAVKELVAHSIEGLGYDQVSLSLFPAHPVETAQPAMARPAAMDAGDRPLVGPLGTRATVILLGALVLAALCLIALPTLLRRQGLDARTWLERQVLRRPLR